MNVEEMIASIDAKVTKDAERKAAAEKAARNHNAELIAKIRDLTPRIQKLLKVTWYAYHNGMPIYGYNGEGIDFQNSSFRIVNSGIDHNIGIMDPEYLPQYDQYIGIQDRKVYLCIKNGGFCGDVDFYTSGDDTFGHHQDDKTGEHVQPRTRDMEDFLKDYDEFETKLLAYIDEWCKK